MPKRFSDRFAAPALVFLACLLISYGISEGFNSYYQISAIFVCVNIILALSLNLINGFTGQFSLGHAGFMAVGAYTSAYVSTQFGIFSGSLEMWNYPIYAVIGGLAAGLAGWAVGQPSLRLKGDYLAIVTLGFGEIIRVLLLNTESVGAARGFYGIPGPNRFFGIFFPATLWVAVTFFVIWRLMRSHYGRQFLSVREDEVAAEAMGVNTTRAKVVAFVISSFFAGVAGSIFAHYTKYLNPSTFTLVKSIDSVIMVILGGMGSFTGSIVAAFIITILPEALRPLQEFTGVDLRMVIYSAVLILLMLTRPKGLFGDKELPDLWRRRATPER